MPNSPDIRYNLKSYRLRNGLSQGELAQKIGMRRQAIIDMEGGKYLPNTVVALRLAKIFNCTVEDLFTLAEDAVQEVHLPEGDPALNTRLALGRVRGRVVGSPLNTPAPFVLRAADGLLSGPNQARLLVSLHALEQSLLVMGCDPALELLNEHLHRVSPAAQVRCLFASSRRALDALAGGDAHLASIHYHNDGSDEANVEAVRNRLGGHMPCRVMAFSLCEEGLMLAGNNPLQIRSLADLARPGVRFINRESGAALRRMLECRLAEEGVPAAAIDGFGREARSHNEGACHVVCGAADAALGLRVVAEAFGLNFMPLAVTRCDLVIPLDMESHPAVDALLDVMQSFRLRRDLAATPGYDCSMTGVEIAVVGKRAVAD